MPVNLERCDLISNIRSRHHSEHYILIVQRRVDLVEKVDSYRAGYTQEERIALEKVCSKLGSWISYSISFLVAVVVC